MYCGGHRGVPAPDRHGGVAHMVQQSVQHSGICATRASVQCICAGGSRGKEGESCDQNFLGLFWRGNDPVENRLKLKNQFSSGCVDSWGLWQTENSFENYLYEVLHANFVLPNIFNPSGGKKDARKSSQTGVPTAVHHNIPPPFRPSTMGRVARGVGPKNNSRRAVTVRVMLDFNTRCLNYWARIIFVKPHVSKMIWWAVLWKKILCSNWLKYVVYGNKTTE